MPKEVVTQLLDYFFSKPVALVAAGGLMMNFLHHQNPCLPSNSARVAAINYLGV